MDTKVIIRLQYFVPISIYQSMAIILNSSVVYVPHTNLNIHNTVSASDAPRTVYTLRKRRVNNVDYPRSVDTPCMYVGSSRLYRRHEESMNNE